MYRDHGASTASASVERCVCWWGEGGEMGEGEGERWVKGGGGEMGEGYWPPFITCTPLRLSVKTKRLLADLISE